MFQSSSVPRGPIIGTKFTIFGEFGPLQVKFNKKIEKYMESELPDIYIVLGFPRIQQRDASAVWCLFQKKHTNILNQTVTLKKVILSNWVYPFVGPRGHIPKTLQKFFYGDDG